MCGEHIKSIIQDYYDSEKQSRKLRKELDI